MREIDEFVRSGQHAQLRALFELEPYTCTGAEFGEGSVLGCEGRTGDVLEIIYVGGWHTGSLGRTFDDALTFFEATTGVEGVVKRDVLEAGGFDMEHLILLTDPTSNDEAGQRSVVGLGVDERSSRWVVSVVLAHIPVVDQSGTSCQLCLEPDDRVQWN